MEKMKRYFYEVQLDNRRYKFLWAGDKKDLFKIVSEEFPESTITAYWRQQ